MSDCLFCALRDRHAGEHLFEDEVCFVLRDLHPQAPVHLLILPKAHVDGVQALAPAQAPAMGHLLVVAASLARQQGVAETGYRLVINSGGDGGQTVFHLHLHLLGGRPFGWPPG